MQFLRESSAVTRPSFLLDGSDREMPMEPISPYDRVRSLASERAVVIFSLSSCCMCHVVKRLLYSLGVDPTVYEIDQEHYGKEIQAVLRQISGDVKQFVPAVFVGGKLIGGLESVMSCHINGTLVPLLKEAGALWL